MSEFDESHDAGEDAPAPAASRPKKMAELTVRVESLAFGGAGVARQDGFVLFIPGTAPGDLARVLLTKRKASYGEAKILELLEPAPSRVQPRCGLFGTCGGCNWQHLPIEEQVRAKEAIVADAVRRQAGIADAIVEPIVASPDTWRYRNKMEFTFQRERDTNRLVAGFHRPGDWRRILDVQECHLPPQPVVDLLRAAVREGDRQNLTAWNPKFHNGTLRQLVVRHCVSEDSLIALLLTGDERGVDFPALVRAMRRAAPNLKGIAWGLNPGQSDVARADRIVASDGELQFEEKLGELSFRVSLASFFQSNSRGAERLYETALEYAELTGRESLLDAYCGTGTIAQYCARRAHDVVGIELLQDAVWDARENARRNGLDNCTFVAGDMRQALPAVLASRERPLTRVIVDPPRGGMEKKALEQLLDIRAPLFVYVSCNPTTMARDLQLAKEAGYVLERVRPVDMFPQTYHIECVAKLRRLPVA